MAPLVLSVIGYIDMDLTMITPRLPDLGECLEAKTYSISPGGKGANAAVAAFRSTHNLAETNDNGPCFENAYDDVEIEVRMIGAVGADAYGKIAIENLRANGIDTSGVLTVGGELTGICFCIVDDRTRENRLLFTTGATSTLTVANFETAESLGHGVKPDLIISQLEVRRDAVEHLIKVAYEAGVEVLLNAAPARVLLMDTYEYVTHLVVNETEAAILSGIPVDEVVESTWPDIAQDFLDRGVRNVVITLGGKGAFFANSHGAGYVPAEQVKLIDSTGAGDTFVGAYATDYLRQKARNEWKIRDAVFRANRASAYTIGKVGAQQAIPWASEIDNFVAEPLSQSISRLSIRASSDDHN